MLLQDHFSAAEVAENLGKSPRTLQMWRTRGVGPPYVKIGHSLYYKKSALLAWLRAQEVKPCPK